MRNIKIEETRLAVRGDGDAINSNYIPFRIEAITLNGRTASLDGRLNIESLKSGKNVNALYNISCDLNSEVSLF